ncbi:MAG TPA: YceH family protein [Solirubrobacteraceae bacterium]|nr:YceH family protein [Solirubrobacteraceae bacterium]
MNLSPSEIRVLGCLLEKQRTTPDVYPLSLNSLRLACNQSTNRDPVVQYDEEVLRDALHRLQRRGYTRLASGAGSRAPKYRHLLAEALPMGEDEQAVVCVLMLRGPQTPGELKQRTERMHAFADLGGVHETLERLIGRELVAVMERRPGQKEERYVQLLGEEAEVSDAPAPSPMAMPAPVPRAVDGLEERVARLEREVAQLRAALGDGPGDEQSSYSGPGESSSHTGPGEEPPYTSPHQEAQRAEAELAATPDNEAKGAGETREWT